MQNANEAYEIFRFIDFDAVFVSLYSSLPSRRAHRFAEQKTDRVNENYFF